MLPRTNSSRRADFHHLARCNGAQDIGDHAILGLVATAITLPARPVASATAWPTWLLG